jgi:hypothetical protein
MPNFTDDDDAWIEKAGFDPKVLHALGVVNVAWNSCEHGLIPLFCAAANMGLERAQLMIHDLGDVTICNKITDLLTLRKDYTDAEKQMILSALEAYEVNRLNRNQLSHFTIGPTGGAELELYRRKGPILMKESFPSALSDIRRVADDITLLVNYITDLAEYFLTKSRNSDPGPLPGIFRAPKRLWTPPPPNPQGRKRQPQSFPAKS